MKTNINPMGKFYRFPPEINEYYYSSVEDLTFTTNYSQFILKKNEFLKKFKPSPDAIFIDMTGNIGCDTANFNNLFPKNIFLTCEIRYETAKCCKENLKQFKNIFVFFGDSNKLLQYYLTEDFEELNKMCLTENLTKSIFGKKIYIIIDPPFSDPEENYQENKKNLYQHLTFQNLNGDYVEIEEYIKEKLKFVDKVILKSPKNWNKRINNCIRIDTRKSFFFFNIISKNTIFKTDNLPTLIGGDNDIDELLTLKEKIFKCLQFLYIQINKIIFILLFIIIILIILLIILLCQN